ncbi:MAG: 4Fe-4S dicluster domain-containing protein [Cyanobacteria bacterium SIG30]|nr:4Fe-4S dicluster domain-containing protein [Cyanobacteria bacterium SIG30]
MNNNSSIENKLSTLKYYTSDKTHLVLDSEKCKKCKNKECLFICPAKVYSMDENNENIKVEYENCLECGACRFACPYNAVSWEYPEASKGVLYKFS